MVSFKSNNCQRDNTTAHCHLPGTLRSPLSYCNNNCNHPPSQGHNHDRAPPRCTPPRTMYPTAVSHGCALHSRLDQPVTSSTPGMDEKKIVQAAPSASPGQHVRTKSVLDGSGVVASISGVRRRSGPQGLRSPAAKRPLSAPVALQGWLHKQGSEGLMLWKKRWFVLSEYCLFYYKGPEEEKLLGSILLPSYCVTVCQPEDKINKKFAFKAEHANMRTYHFAADSREIMNQWVNALTLATLLQDPNPDGGGGGNGGEAFAIQEIAGPADGEHSARPSVSSISSILNQSADDSDSGFHGFQSRDDPTQSNNNSSPNSINTASFPNLSASNSNHLIANNNTINNNNNNNNNNAETPMQDAQQPQPLMNGWMHPPPQFSQPSTSQQQYGHITQNPIQSQQHQQQQLHPQHQALMHQQMVRQQQHQQLIQQQQMQQPSTSNIQPIPRNFGQPVYANAPPKPRRLTDGSIDYSTPSPDPEYRQSPVQPLAGIRMTAKSPIGDYDRGNVIYASRLAQQSIPPPLRTDKSGLNYGYNQGQPAAERRTPDTYGRSAKPRISRPNGDYEDVYSGPQLYQRPPGPVGYTKGAAPNPISIPIYAQHGQTNQQQVCSVVVPANAPIMRQPRAQPPPRPHSADFLEYEATKNPICQTDSSTCGDLNQNKKPQRPKSSLDVVGMTDIVLPSDGYFYSEERYAAQMRQSAVYLHQTPQHNQQQRNQSLSRATTPSNPNSRGDDLNNSISSTETPCTSIRRTSRDTSVYRQHPMATQSLQRYPEASTNEAMIRRSLRERSYDPTFRDSLIHDEGGTIPRRVTRDHEANSLTPRGNFGTHLSHSYHAGHPNGRRSNDQQFARSASARLPRTRHPNAPELSDDNEYSERTPGPNTRDGERRIQQREESMKRLLEWKQRMLQSPLTRKPSGPANGNATAQSELSSYYKRQALLDLAAHEASVAEARHSRRRDDSHRPHTRSKSSDGRRSVANVSRYNSYSSDDEASGSGSIIGRDPLPPRALSTSQLAVQNPLTQPPIVISTLPHARVNGRERQQISTGHPIHQSTPQSNSSRNNLSVVNDNDSTIGRAASTNDVQASSSILNNETSSESSQRMVSPSRNLRVISPIDHRVSTPSDNERHIHNSNERKLAASPISIREMNGDSGNLRQMHRARLTDLDAPRRLENLQKLEELKKHLMNLEKQYEKGKPLVNLVDNMVKLGSLYNRNGVNGSVAGSRHDLIQTQENAREHRDRLEFNQRIQEQKLLAEERRDWERLSPDHGQLQAKVQQLYKLDRLLQEESGTLHSLQQDKEILEKALGGLKHKLQGSRSNPVETERYRKQQILLERELSRVRMLLAHNSKKLEETVAENARLEQDLVVLRQKLQASRHYTGNIAKDSSGTTAALEAELRRVQQLVGDLQRQRQELSVQVRQLTEKSHNLVQQIKPNDPSTVLPVAQVHHTKKRTQSSWLETDLDSGMTFDHGLASPSSSNSSMSPRIRQNGSPHQHIPPPQYKDPPSHRYSPTQPTRQAQPNTQSIYIQPYSRSGGNNVQTHDHISALSPQLRAQIQQHQLKQQLLKDQMQGKASPVQSNVPLYVNTDLRRNNCNDGMKRIDSSMTNGGSILPPEYVPPPPPPPSEESLLMNGNYGQQDDNRMSGLIHNREKQEIKTVRIVKRESERRQRDRGDRSGNIGIPLTNGIQSPGGAKRIGDEEFGTQQFEKPQLDRVVEETPTMHAQSTVQLTELDDIQFQRSMSLPRGFGGQRPQPGIHNGPVPPPPRSDSMNALRNMMARRHRAREMGRARDDLDMERALRPRMNAPDVVRSTLSHKELKYNESTIDQLLGTPNKIFIPERYIPEYTPELSAEEKKIRLKKADAIRKMLSETTVAARDDDEDIVDVEKTNSLKKKVAAEKRQRDHILQLNQILAKQVMEKSKMVAVKALTTLPLNSELSLDDDDPSPVTPLPLYQQRENFYS